MSQVSSLGLGKYLWQKNRESRLKLVGAVSLCRGPSSKSAAGLRGRAGAVRGPVHFKSGIQTPLQVSLSSYLLKAGSTLSTRTAAGMVSGRNHGPAAVAGAEAGPNMTSSYRSSVLSWHD